MMSIQEDWCYGFGTSCARFRGPVSQWLFDNMTVFGGVRLVNDDINLNHRDAFATHSGFNWSGPFITPLQLSGQFGFRAVQSNFNQDQLVPANYFRETGVWEPYRNQIRTQYFLTAGLFKRFPIFPLQFGAAYDFCFDDTYQSMRYGQIRAEVSVRFLCGLEVGARTAVSAGTHDVPFHYVNFGGETPVESLGEYQLQTNGYTVLFVQKHHDIGANGKIFGGASYSGAFLCGVEYEVPLTARLTLQSGFSAMFQNSMESVTGAKRENWDVYFSLVYYPHGREFNHISNPLRAMFSVADNGSMKSEFVHRRTSVVP